MISEVLYKQDADLVLHVIMSKRWKGTNWFLFSGTVYNYI